MRLTERHRWIGPYLIAVLVTLIAAAVREASGHWLDAFRSQPFLIAVVISAWIGGSWPGLLSVALSAIALAGETPGGSFWVDRLPHLTGLMLFVASGIGVCFICERVRANARGERRTRQVAEQEIEVRARLETSLRESEEKFRLVCEGLPQIVTTMTPEGVVDYVNPYWLAYSGLTLEQTVRREWVTLLHPDDAELVLRRFDRALQAGQALDRTFRLRRADGHYRWFQAQMTPVRAADGHIRKWISLLVDVEDRMRIEEHTRRAYLNAEHASRLKDEFLATVSHELRTPLNAILGWTDMLKRGAVEESKKEQALETIRRNARRQAELINDLLDMTRIMNGRLQLEIRTLDLDPILRSAVDAILPSATARGLTVRLAADSAGSIEGDSTRVQQIVANLLSNAVKFTPAGGVIDVFSSTGDHEVAVTVRDNGAGIAANFLPHVFDRFRQADSSRTRRQGGVGLGLAITRQLVELHGGRITVTSEGLGKGSSFVVVLPSRRSEDGDALLRADAPSRLPALHGVRVLVIDDEPDACEVGRMILQNCGAEVLTAGSADEAYDILEREPVAVILADIGMPDEDGYAFIRRVRAANNLASRTPAAAITAYASGDDRERALEAGYQLHLSKPVDPNTLANAVVQLLKQSGAPSVSDAD